MSGSGNHNNHAKASKTARWKPGSRSGTTGHIKVRVGKSHPLADPNGYAYEHLVVWVSAGNPRPLAGEVIHHINEDKSDNRIENLRLMTRIEHSQMHSGALSDAQVREIRECYARNEADMPTLALRFDISVARVSKFIRGQARLSAGGPISTSNRGKARAGRLLDGLEHNDMPGVR